MRVSRREKAVDTLAVLLKTPEERTTAVRTVQFIVGPIGEMAPKTLDMLQQFHRVLELPVLSGDVAEDPLITPARDLPEAEKTARVSRRTRPAETTETAA